MIRHESFAQRAGNGFGGDLSQFQEDNPSKIVSGFGGTFCLVMSLLYIVGGILCLAIGSPWAQHATFFKTALAWGAFCLLSLLIGYLPYRIGIRRLRYLEI